jgi:hypothetical protein
MNTGWKCRRRICGMFAGAVILLAVTVPQVARAAATDSPSLTMEELEVRGRLEKPDRLFVPVSWPIVFPSPARMDLFREDMLKPVLPWEIPNGDPPGGFPRK